MIFTTHEALYADGVLKFEDWCLMIERVAQILGVHILLTW